MLMEISPELYNLIIRFGFNLFVAFIIIKLIYHRDHQGNDFAFTYFMFNSLIFFFAYLLGNIDINMGFGFGMFAVFAILRYRTNPIPIKEMTYLFIAIAIGVINALSGTNEVSFDVLMFTNITLVVLTYLLERYWQHNALVIRSVEYEIIENIKPENHEKLLLDLENRVGMPIMKFEIHRINFLRDTVRISIYCKN